MKIKLLSLLLCLSFILAGCGAQDNAIEDAAAATTEKARTEVLKYPGDTGIEFMEYAPLVPEEIYSSTAKENGLDGEIYMIMGTVEEYFFTDAEVGFLRVDTVEGEVVVADALGTIRASGNQEILNEINFEKMRSYCPIPEEGEFCIIFAEYQGMSNTFNCPFFVYASSDYLTEALLLSFREESDMSESDGSLPPATSMAPDETTPSSTQASQPPSPSTTVTQPSQPESPTTSESNALKKAKEYLQVMPFSRNGLIDQLEYEGFSTNDATYGADNCGADWNEQALEKAKDYLETMAFSYSGLVDQLEYEGFTSSQAKHGADNCGADWYEQAAKSAAQYVSLMTFTRSDLISQLEYGGFTHDQAVHGADSVGL